MKTIYKVLITSLIYVIFMSCNGNKKNGIKLENNKTIISTIKYEINFPDTIYINKNYHGEINYESVLDTVITYFGDENKNRYTRLLMKTDNKIDKDLNISILDTFGAIDNRTIPFYDIKFETEGTKYIQGVINDIVSINLFKKDDDGNNLLRFIEINEPILHKIVVIGDSSKVESTPAARSL